MTAALELENVGKTFFVHRLGKKIRACEAVTMSLDHGEFLGITGRSGSGKSTLLKMIYRTYLPQQGSIRYDSRAFGLVRMEEIEDRAVLFLRRYEIGYVSQFLQVIPRSTARDVVEQAVIEMGTPKGEAVSQAEEMLSHFEIDRGLWDSYVSTFSGGEKLRVNIARAMVKKPRLLLLDEPTASLDSQAKLRVRELIEKLKAEGTTMLGIFHDLHFMAGVCDREYSMEEGRVLV